MKQKPTEIKPKEQNCIMKQAQQNKLYQVQRVSAINTNMQMKWCKVWMSVVISTYEDTQHYAFEDLAWVTIPIQLWNLLNPNHKSHVLNVMQILSPYVSWVKPVPPTAVSYSIKIIPACYQHLNQQISQSIKVEHWTDIIKIDGELHQAFYNSIVVISIDVYGMLFELEEELVQNPHYKCPIKMLHDH
ncbi:hypothetical protein ARMGADRAFT_1031221 [Armillaria gallica]|uniref:Uncharacterized protein n=1 Tax=Armillaria gallica TaxID=47427 RepID=A0A2H3DAU0_ARMGA|nr:hypothetical protein ARMGADRAFT_1031221 [Armillaria gallica]